MPRSKKSKIGAITWMDLTVKNAAQVSAFYREVVGWNTSELDMGGYSDYCMNTPADAKTVAGVCHARGVNKDLPPQWLIYITVADIDLSVKKCLALGGKLVTQPRDMGEGRMAVIQDPAGAIAALYQPMDSGH